MNRRLLLPLLLVGSALGCERTPITPESLELRPTATLVSTDGLVPGVVVLFSAALDPATLTARTVQLNGQFAPEALAYESYADPYPRNGRAEGHEALLYGLSSDSAAASRSGWRSGPNELVLTPGIRDRTGHALADTVRIPVTWDRAADALAAGFGLTPRPVPVGTERVRITRLPAGSGAVFVTPGDDAAGPGRSPSGDVIRNRTDAPVDTTVALGDLTWVRRAQIQMLVLILPDSSLRRTPVALR